MIGVLTKILLERRKERDEPGKKRPNEKDPAKDPGSSFCIPVAFLHDALAAVERTTDRDRLSQEVTARYAAEMVTLQICAEDHSGKTVLANLNARLGGDVLGAQLDVYQKDQKEFMKALQPAIQCVRTTPHLSRSTKKMVLDLLGNHEQVVRHTTYRGPMHVLAYIQRYNNLMKNHEKLAKPLFKELDIPDTVTVRLLDESMR